MRTFKIFDEVISIVEANPGDASDACQTLTKVGKIHKTRVHFMMQPCLKKVARLGRRNEKGRF
jgi:hypothetical protein